MTGPIYRCPVCKCHPAEPGLDPMSGLMSSARCYGEVHALAAELVDAALGFWATPMGTPEQQREASRYEDAHTDKARALLALCEKVEG